MALVFAMIAAALYQTLQRMKRAEFVRTWSFPQRLLARLSARNPALTLKQQLLAARGGISILQAMQGGNAQRLFAERKQQVDYVRCISKMRRVLRYVPEPRRTDQTIGRIALGEHLRCTLVR